MIAYAVALAFVSSPIEWPPCQRTDLSWMPPLAQVRAEMSANRQCQDGIAGRVGVQNREPVLLTLRQRYAMWDALETAWLCQSDSIDCDGTVRALERLRTLAGTEAYYSGCLPAGVPSELFEVAD